MYDLLSTIGITLYSTATLESAVLSGSFLHCFSPTDICKLTLVVSHSKPVICLLDPNPSQLFKEFYPTIDPIILDLLNASLTTGYEIKHN